MAADPRATVRPMWHDQCLITGDPPAPVVLGFRAWERIPAEHLVLLGLDNDIPNFAADLSDLARDDAVACVGATGTADVRNLFPSLAAAESAAIAYARGLLRWNRYQRYCGCCGSLTVMREAGHMRACARAKCGALWFPRIDPAVIVIVQTADPPRRCLLAQHRTSTTGGYSTLAGFVEVGESLEETVRREVHEEVGVTVSTVDYVGSQPWPFPAGLMIGFQATAADQSISVDGDEIVAARWFSRAQLAAGEAGRLGRADSIGHVMLGAWLASNDDDRS